MIRDEETSEVGAPGETDGVLWWEAHAQWWGETFANGADPEYELQILPLVASRLEGCKVVLDVGTGEGQLARHLAATDPDVSVVGLDPARLQLVQATRHGGAPRYVRGRGEQLPFRDGRFDAVVCCLVIEHVDDPDQLLSEAVRQLVPGGRLVLVVNHPLFQGAGSGLIDDQILQECYWRVGPYLVEEITVEEVEPGIRLPFRHRPLSAYVNLVASMSCPLVSLDEPAPLEQFLADSVAPELEAAIPRLAVLCFVKGEP